MTEPTDECDLQEQARLRDIILGRKIFLALTPSNSAGIPFPSVLDLSGQVYAIHGKGGAGKTLLVEDACISALFRGTVVVFVDSDYRLNVLGFLGRLQDICKSRSLPSTHFKSACRNMIVQKCGTSTELDLFLSFKLRQILRTSNVGLVVVDSLTSFFWHDRYTRSNWKAFYDSIWVNLKRLGSEYGLTLMITIQDLYSKQEILGNFLHCAEVRAISIRVQKLDRSDGRAQFLLVDDSDEKAVLEMRDGKLIKIDPPSLTESRAAQST